MSNALNAAAAILMGVMWGVSASAETAQVKPVEPDQIVSRGYYWGKPTTSWGLSEDGSGWVSTTRSGATFSEYTLVTKRWGPSPGHFQHLKATLREAERFAGRKLPCRNMLTDGPYGEVTWRIHGASKTVAYSSGCMSPTSDRLFATFASAWSEIQTLAATATTNEEQTIR